MATLRQIGHNLLKNKHTLKVGIQGKRLNVGWNEGNLVEYDAIALRNDVVDNSWAL